MNSEYHIPVLRDACIEGLAMQENGIYIDATFGGGGHSSAILHKMKGGRLIAFDRDADAQPNIPENENFTLVHHDFIHLKNYLRYMDVIPVDGILADLGISSYQVDTAERGFSFRFEAPLDMRMDRQNPITASHVLNEEPEAQLVRIFSEYGEVKNSKTLARAVVAYRKVKPIRTTGQLVQIAEEVLPGKENIRKYMAPVFQALRIAVNDELNGLRSFLDQCKEVLKPDGRLVVLTYHSLEDRIVKNFLQETEKGISIDKNIYGQTQSAWEMITRKPIVPDEAEIEKNPRARSAKLRIAQKSRLNEYL